MIKNMKTKKYASRLCCALLVVGVCATASADDRDHRKSSSQKRGDGDKRTQQRSSGQSERHASPARQSGNRSQSRGPQRNSSGDWGKAMAERMKKYQEARDKAARDKASSSRGSSRSSQSRRP